MAGSMEIVRGILALILLQSISIPSAETSDILFAIPISTRSEKDFYEPLIGQLGKLGHNVTVITSHLNENLPQNVREFMPVPEQEIYGKFITALNSPFSRFDFISYHLAEPIFKACHKILKDPKMQTLLNANYDLVFTTALVGNCFYGFIYKNQSPFIEMSTYPIPHHLMLDLGTILPVSVVPHPLLKSSNVMNFYERLINYGALWYQYVHNKYVSEPAFENVYRQYYGDDTPSVAEIRRNVSLVMTNTHFTSTFPRSLMPDAVEVGCMHCKKPKPLPKDLENFVSESPDGFLLVSFGTVAPTSAIQTSDIAKFLNVFSRLKQRIIWKFDTKYKLESPVPPNVLLTKWVPQQDLLGHPKMRLFISHAGLLSTQQSIFHAVPSLFVPLFFDQYSNTEAAIAQGFALSLDYFNFSEQELEQKINRLLLEPAFQENANKVSGLFKTHMGDPVEKAVFWTNFILEHGGAPQLRSPARNMNILQVMSLDIFLFIFATLFVVYIFAKYLANYVLFSVGFKKQKTE